jgi:hypothetical protein
VCGRARSHRPHTPVGLRSHRGRPELALTGPWCLRGESVGSRTEADSPRLAMSHLTVTVVGVDERQLEAHCGCGATWWLYVESDPDDVLPQCTACGETVVDVRDCGPHHSAGRDVAP